MQTTTITPGDVLFQMFLSYVRSEDFGDLSQKQREDTCDTVDQINELIKEDISRGRELGDLPQG
jgi:hypothetical protein